MERLDDNRVKEKAEHIRKIREANEKVVTAIQDAQAWIDEVKSEIEEYYSEQEEKWQEGKKGQAYADWLAAWEMELDEPNADAADEMEDLPHAP